MNSNDRIEVAKKLRLWAAFPGNAGEIVFDVLGCEVIGNDPRGTREAARRLADLIDPTCHDVSEPPENGFWPAPHFECSECGGGHVSTDYVDYCPHCGARVVEP